MMNLGLQKVYIRSMKIIGRFPSANSRYCVGIGSSEILVCLNNGAQACSRSAVPTLKSIVELPDERLRRSDIGLRYPTRGLKKGE